MPTGGVHNPRSRLDLPTPHHTIATPLPNEETYKKPSIMLGPVVVCSLAVLPWVWLLSRSAWCPAVRAARLCLGQLGVARVCGMRWGHGSTWGRYWRVGRGGWELRPWVGLGHLNPCGGHDQYRRPCSCNPQRMLCAFACPGSVSGLRMGSILN